MLVDMVNKYIVLPVVYWRVICSVGRQWYGDIQSVGGGAWMPSVVEERAVSSIFQKVLWQVSVISFKYRKRNIEGRLASSNKHCWPS